jgi:hypothetical protein
MSRESDQKRYDAACHAMQTGVKWEMEYDLLRGVEPHATTPKHLRVGVNSALVSHGALVKLLVEKGVITEDEYVTSQADAMEAEVKLYEDRANRGNVGGPVLHFG